MSKKEYLRLVDLLNNYIYEYYVNDNQIVTDTEYDMLYKDIKAYEAEHSYVSDNSPTKRVGQPVTDKFIKAKHLSNMWSLDNVFNKEELKKWYLGLGTNIEVYCEPKFDGASLNIIYENGALKQGITRGDGSIGEDITPNVKTIKSIPLTIPYKDTLEIRGEVVIYKNNFKKLNEDKLNSGGTVYSNSRNLASGSLRKLDPSETNKRKLTFLPYSVGVIDSNKTTTLENMEMFYSFGFKKPDKQIVCENWEQLNKTIDIFIQEKDNFLMDIDGIVIKVNNIKEQKYLGFTSRAPKHAIAYKFESVNYTTILKDIILQVGRHGTITPVAMLEPITIDGVVVSKATLHNFDEIVRKDIRINDTVMITRSGEVIPKILGVVKSFRTDEVVEYELPKVCPSCGTSLVNFRCLNKTCREQIIGRISYFVSKDCLDVSGLGSKVVERLVNNKIVYKPMDILKLKYSDIDGLEGFRTHSINKLLHSIDSVKGLPLHKLINALDIPNVGRTASKEIANRFGIEFMDTPLKEYMGISGFGNVILTSLDMYLKTNKGYVKELINILNPTTPKDMVFDSIYTGKRVVITGNWDIPRSKMIETLESQGATVTNTVSKNTDILLSSGTTGKKYNTAVKLGIMIKETL